MPRFCFKVLRNGAGSGEISVAGRTVRNSIWALAGLLAGLAALPSATAHAHDIPNDVKVEAWVRPEGRTLTLLLRVPLGAMREADLPLAGPGYIDIARADPALQTAARLWLVDNLDITENGVLLPRATVTAARVSLAADRSFNTWPGALAALAAPRLDQHRDLFWRQQQMDVRLEVPIGADTSAFAIHPRFARMGLQVLTVLHYLPPGGDARAFTLHGDPGVVALDPRWHQAAWRYLADGIRHILDGTDHLLFILCLVIPFRRLRPLAVIITAFTVAHSVTLLAAAYGLAPDGLWFPPLVETLIAASILWMALENILGSTAQRRWIMAFAFGLVHGFGFAFTLRESLQFAGEHLVTALLAFNAGVEIGQLAVLCVLVPALQLLFRRLPERATLIVLSALVAHTGWHWMVERGEALRKFPWPVLDAAALAGLLRWLAAGLVIAALVWLADRRLRRWLQVTEQK